MQTSQKKLPPGNHTELVNDLTILLADLQTPADVRAFLNLFFSPTEQTVFAKRLAIATMLDANFSYNEIRQTLHVSSATISTTSEMIAQPGWKVVKKKLQLQLWAKNMSAKITSFIHQKSSPTDKI